MARAQGALEYLVVLATVVSISAVMAYLFITYFGAHQEEYLYDNCKSAASMCAAIRAIDVADPCTVCDDACRYSDGAELFTTSTICCKIGDLDSISLQANCEFPPPAEVCFDGTAAGECSEHSIGQTCIWNAVTQEGSLTPRCSECPCAEGLVCDYNDDKCGVVEFYPTSVTQDQVSAYGLAAGDADNDLSNEIVIGLMRTNVDNVRVYEFINGRWEKTVLRSEDPEVLAVAVGDADNVQGNEVVVGTLTSSTKKELSMYKYDSTARAWSWTPIADTSTILYLAIGNADNIPGNELVVASYLKLLVFKSGPSGWSSREISSEGNIINSLAIGDADNDGLNEIVIGTWNQAGAELKIFDYDRTTDSWLKTDIADIGEIESIDIGDADNDGKNEIVIGGFLASDQLRMYKHINNAWQEFKLFDYGRDQIVNGIKIGDADNDGKNEIIIGLYRLGNHVRMLEYNSFTDKWEETVIDGGGTTAYLTEIINLDGDADKEIVVGFHNDFVEVYDSIWTYY